MAPVFYALRTTRWERFPLPPGEGCFLLPPEATGGCGGRSWVDARKNVLLSSMQSFFAYLAGKAIFRRRARANRRGILDAMNREHGYTLMETLGNADTDDDPQRRRPVRLAALAAAATTVANRRPVRDFLLFLRDDANAYNRDRVLRVGRRRSGLVPERGGGRGLTAPRGHPSRCARAGRGSLWLALRLVWGFMVCAAPPGRGICGCRARPAAGAL